MTKSEREALNKLIIAGSKLSNIAYNLQQHKGNLTEHHQRSMGLGVSEWDAALGRIESELKAGK